MLKIALPNGTLEACTIQFFNNAGIALAKVGRCFHAQVSDSRVSRATFMRPQIIPQMVQWGRYDLGIVGSDVLAETGSPVTVLSKLDFNARGAREFSIVLVGSKDDPAKSLKDIPPGSWILSEYPSLTKLALKEARIDADVMTSFGATEAHIPHDFRYGVCVVSTGETLEANGLKGIHVFSTETTVFIGGPSRFDGGLKENAALSLLGDLLAGREANSA